MAVRPTHRDHVAWYRSTRPAFDALAKAVAATIGTLLGQAGIEGASVSSRAKEIGSFSEKLKRKRYAAPRSEMTDLAGVRVVTLIERDVQRVAELVRGAFSVHADASPDKSAELGVDRFGYKSVHLVCEIGAVRAKLPEVASLAGLLFEVQVRTALQHAWAEIEHDRSYKFSGELPSQLRRRFYLVAGLLELADREFSTLTEELERYTSEARRKASDGTLDFELNSTTALELLKELIARRGGRQTVEYAVPNEDVLGELRDFGVRSIADLRAILTEDMFAAMEHIPNTTVGVLRDAMIYSDVDHYFESAWNGRWNGWDTASLSIIEAKYGKSRIFKIMQRHGISVAEPEDF